MSSTDFKFYGSIFRQDMEKLKERLGDNFDPTKKYAFYTGSLSIPTDVVIDLIDYLSTAEPVADKSGKPSVRLKIQGWVKKTETGTAYQSLSIEPDYKTVQKMKGELPAPAPAPAQPAIDNSIPF